MAHITTLTRAHSANTGVANTFSYSGSFDVFLETEVIVKLDGTALTYQAGTINESASPRQYTVDISAKTIHIGGADLSSGTIEIYPNTSMGSPTARATFTPGSNVDSADLNNNQTQILRKLMEHSEQKLSKSGGTMTGDLTMGEDTTLIFEGATDDGYETTLTVADPTADRTITIPNVTGSVVTTGDTGTVATAMIADDAVTNDKLANSVVASISANTSKSTNATHTGDVTGSGALTIANNAVTTAKIDSDAVDGTKIADNAINSEHYVDGSIDTAHIADLQVTTAKIAADAITGAKILDDAIDSEHYTDGSIDLAHLASGSVDSTKMTAATVVTNSEQAAATANDTSFFTTSASDARYFNISSGDTIKDGVSFPDNDTTIATTAAINDRIIDLVDDVGGFVPLASEAKFPAANPDVNNGAGTIVSIGVLGASYTPSTGTCTIPDGTLDNISGSNVTITDCGSTVLAAGYGCLVETTTTLHQYKFHRLTPKATEVTTVAGSVANVNTVAGSISNVNTTAGSIANVNTTAGSISNVNTTAGSIANVNTVASNIANVNSFADTYQIDDFSPSAPTTDGGGNSVAEGDLAYDSTANRLKVYTGSAWEDGVTAPSDLISRNTIDAKGDLLTGSADNTVIRTAVGSNGKFLKADSGASGGVSWDTVTQTDTTYSISCVDGDAADEEKIRLTAGGSGSGTDDVVLEAGTGLSIARDGDKITFTNTVSDTNTQLSDEQVQDIVGAMFSGNTETNITVTYQDGDGTIDLVSTDTTYTVGDGGLTQNNFTNTLKTKLDGIEASADVTDATNVDSAGAVMNSDLDGKGELLVGDGSGDPSALGVGSNGQFLKADSSTATGLAWAADNNTTYTVGDGGLTENNFTNALKSKLDGIEASATADQTSEEIQDVVGAMFSSNTETGITVTYQDADGTIDLVVASQTDENFTSADHTKLDGIEASADVTDATNVNAAGAIMHTDLGTKGQIVVGDGSGDATILAVGSNNYVLTADSGESSGVKWAAAATGTPEGTAILSTGETGGTKFLREDGDNSCSWQSVPSGVTQENVEDWVGGMVTGNTETGITVTYQDGDGTLDFEVGTLNQDTTGTADNFTVSANNSADETVYPVFVDGATGSQGAETDTGLTYNPSTGVLTTTQVTGNLTGTVTGTATGLAGTPSITVDDVVAASLDISGSADIDGTMEADAYTVDGTALDEYIADTVGAMVGSNTESGITVAYQDADNTLDFTVGTLNQDTTGTAAIATTVTVADESSDTTCFPLFVTTATGDQAPKSGSNLTFNSNTGALGATSFTGDGANLTNLPASIGDIVEHKATMTGNHTIGSGNNGLVAGPFSTGSYTLTVPSGSVFTVV